MGADVVAEYLDHVSGTRNDGLASGSEIRPVDAAASGLGIRARRVKTRPAATRIDCTFRIF